MTKQTLHPLPHPRLQREERTVKAMIAIYCRAHHPGQGGKLCQDCQALLDYARTRLLHCPFGQSKPTCGKCEVHCYKPAMQRKIKEVMQYSGPRMIGRHPVLALFHLLDGSRRAMPKHDVKKPPCSK